MEPARPTGRIIETTLDGKLLPWAKGQPVWIEAEWARPGEVYLPVFSTREGLERGMAEFNARYERIKKIDEQEGFLASLPPEIKVMLDPYRTPEGKTRWKEIQR
jgi:hypothetical protein